MSVVSFRTYLTNNPVFEQMNGLYYQRGLKREQPFETVYKAIRATEGRLYTDEIVSKLPEIAEDHPLKHEWAIRKKSALRLIQYLKKKKPGKVLEVGCGNGWLINQIWLQVGADCCGVDVNETELKQANAVFGEWDTLSFLYGDIESGVFDSLRVDVIVIASVLQYFSHPERLLSKLRTLLNPGGEIHIIDSPFYHENAIAAAKERSRKYFEAAGEPAMTSLYFHHPWKVLDTFHKKILHRPDGILGKVLQRFFYYSPFPWVVIEK
jgi:ubiquinone/menaquinone biosynthesis C-methylase UbiE